MNSVIFFYDYDKESGNGHYLRCKKIKKIFSKNSKFVFLKSGKKKFLEKNKTVFEYGVVDSYKITFNAEKKLKKFCKKLITIDDLNNRKFASDVLINYSPVAKKKDYFNKVNINTKLLIGNKYNFVIDDINERTPSDKNKFVLFFYLGQRNRSHILKQMLQSIKEKKRVKKVFIFGNKKKIQPHKLLLKKMELSDILIISSGVTLHEGLSRKKLIFSKAFSKNQRSFYNFYKKKKLIYSFSKFKNFINSPIAKINHEIQNQRKKTIFEPYNKQLFHVRTSILPIFDSNQNTLFLKSYHDSYCRKLYNLQNKDNRKYFKSKKTFSFSTHKNYIKKFLTKKKNLIYLVFSGEIFVGFVKLEFCKNKFFVSIIIDKMFRGRSIATKVLTYFKQSYIFGKNLVAEISKKNSSSLTAFRNAKFQKKDIILF